MFLLRSAFWLTVAYVVIAPTNVDLGAATDELTKRATAAGQQAVISTILDPQCDALCVGGKAISAAADSYDPSGDPSMRDSLSLEDPVPFPRPRPARMG